MKIVIIFILACITSGCFQAHSDDDLRTVPSTNNPHIIMSDKRSGVPGANF